MNVNKKEYLTCLDGLKGLAACGIAFLYHYPFLGGAGPLSQLFFPLYEHGGVFIVQIFFILSGFGMMAGYGERIVNKTINFKNYIAKRLKKLYPSVFISTIIVTVFQLLYMAKTGNNYILAMYFDAYHFILNLLLLQTGIIGADLTFNIPAWFVSVCFAMYVIFFVITSKASHLKNVYYAHAFILLLGLILLTQYNEYPLVNQTMAKGLSGFSLGVLFHGIYKKINSRLLGNILLIFLVITYFYINNQQFRFMPEEFGFAAILFTIIFAPAVIISAINSTVANKIFSLKPLIALGKISMAIYLFHFPLQCMIKVIEVYCNLNINYSSIEIWLSYIGIVLVFSYVYTNYFEPALRRKIKCLN